MPSEFRDVTIEGTLSLGNASSGYDGVRLIDCPGQIQDSLLYAKDDAVSASDEEITEGDNGDTSAASLPESGLSLGRIPDGSDSDVNSVDFQSNLEPTPGGSQMEVVQRASQVQSLNHQQKAVMEMTKKAESVLMSLLRVNFVDVWLGRRLWNNSAQKPVSRVLRHIEQLMDNLWITCG